MAAALAFNPCTLSFYSSILNQVASSLPVVQSYCTSKYPLTASTITETTLGSLAFSTQTAYLTLTSTSDETITVVVPSTSVASPSTSTIATITVSQTATATYTNIIAGLATVTVCPSMNPMTKRNLPETCKTSTLTTVRPISTLTISSTPAKVFSTPSKSSSTPGKSSSSTTKSSSSSSATKSISTPSWPAYDATLCSCIEKPRTSTVVVTSIPVSTVTQTLTVNATPVTSITTTSSTTIGVTTPIILVTATTTTADTVTVTTDSSTTATATVTAGAGGIYDESQPPGGGCGCDFEIYCGYGANEMNVERSLTTVDYQTCVAACDSQNNCDYTVFNGDTMACSLSTSYQGEAVNVADSVLIIKSNPGSCANQGAATCTNQ